MAQGGTEAAAQAVGRGSETMSDGKLWLEFVSPDALCGLCGNSGMIDTTGLRSPAGLECGIRRPCICPNGRALAGQPPCDHAWKEHMRYVALGDGTSTYRQQDQCEKCGQLGSIRDEPYSHNPQRNRG